MAIQTSDAPAPPSQLTDDTIVSYNSAFMPLRDATVSVAAHALHDGTGCFEGIRAYWSEERGDLYVLKLEEHIERFFRSCGALPYSGRCTPVYHQQHVPGD